MNTITMKPRSGFGGYERTITGSSSYYNPMSKKTKKLIQNLQLQLKSTKDFKERKRISKRINKLRMNQE